MNDELDLMGILDAFEDLEASRELEAQLEKLGHKPGVCPPLHRFPDAEWDDAERKHVTNCPYCQRMIALAWRSQCPDGFTVVRNALPNGPDSMALRFHIQDQCPTCAGVFLRFAGAVNATNTSAVAYAGRFPLEAAAAGQSRPNPSVSHTSPDGKLSATLRVSDDKKLLLRVNGEGRARARLLLSEGEPLTATVTCGEDHIFAPYSDVLARLLDQPFALIVEPPQSTPAKTPAKQARAAAKPQSKLEELKAALEEHIERWNRWEDLAGDYGLLRDGLREAVQSHEMRNAASELRQCYQLMTQARVEKPRLHRNSLALIATAEAAIAAKDELVAGDAWPRLLERWRDAATQFNDGKELPEANPASFWPKARGAQHRLEMAAETLRGSGWPVEALRRWTLYWLGVRVPDQLRIPVGAYSSIGGVIEDLYLTDLGDSPCEMVEHPESALRSLGDTLLATLKTQWTRHTQKPVFWRLIPRSPARRLMPLDGPSLAAAAAVGFGCLDQGLPHDSDCLITAIVAEDGSLVEVGGEAEKLRAAFEQGMRKAVVAVSVNRPHTVFDALRSQGMEIAELKTLADAVEFACGYAGGLKKYYRKLIDRADENPAPYLFGHTPSVVYIQPNVLLREQRRERHAARPGEGEQEQRQEQPKDIGEASKEVGEDLYGERVYDVERARPWEEVLVQLRERRIQCAVVLGPPGQGKSELVKMTARQLALEQTALLERQERPARELLLPVAVTFEDLASVVGRRSGRSPGERLAGALAAVLKGQGCAPAVIDGMLRSGKRAPVWLFLDALDELAEEKHSTMVELMAVLRESGWPLVIASRPYGYEEWQFPFQQHQLGEFRLAPLSRPQSESFVETWFAAGARKDAAKRLLERSPSVQAMAQNPFLLTLICAVEERQELPEDVTRTELYKRVIDRLLGNTKRAAEWTPMLEEINWLAFERNPRQPRLEAGELLDLLQKSDNQPSAKREKGGTRRAAVKLHDELVRKRLLVAFDQAKKYCWPHRSIAEYLAASSLGDCETAWDGISPKKNPGIPRGRG